MRCWYKSKCPNTLLMTMLVNYFYWLLCVTFIVFLFSGSELFVLRLMSYLLSLYPLLISGIFFNCFWYYHFSSAWTVRSTSWNFQSALIFKILYQRLCSLDDYGTLSSAGTLRGDYDCFLTSVLSGLCVFRIFWFCIWFFYFVSAFWCKIFTIFLSAAIIPLLYLVIGWLSYYVLSLLVGPFMWRSGPCLMQFMIRFCYGGLFHCLWNPLCYFLGNVHAVASVVLW